MILDACAVIAFFRDEEGAAVARISLADCFALTLAHRESGILVTSDRKEFEPIAHFNICPIEFIR